MTSIPASRRARAITLAPRSWPSRPGLAMSTRIFLGNVDTSVEEGLLPDAEGLTHDAAHLAEGRTGPHRVDDEGHRVRVALAPLAQRVQGALPLLPVPRSADPPEALELGLQGRFGHPQRLELGLLVHGEVVHAHDRPHLVLDFALVTVRGVRDLLLEVPLPDRRD